MSYLNSVESNVLNVRPVTLFNDGERKKEEEDEKGIKTGKIRVILILMVMFVSLLRTRH